MALTQVKGSSLDQGIVRTFDSVADMVAATGLSIGDKVQTLGYYSAGDGGGNIYEIVAAGTGTADGGSFIDLTGISGQAKGLFVEGIISAKQFGAVLDGATDDSAAIAAAKAFSLTFSTYRRGTIFYPRRVPVDNPNVDLVDGRVEIIAHRGFAYQNMENTLLAFSSALDAGADALETDVQVSSDGVLYCFHDDTVDGLTDGSGTFTSLSSATIDSLKFDNLIGTPLEDVKIPRFEDFLDIAKERGVVIYPEIKGYRTQQDIEMMVDAVVARGMEDQTVFQAFDLNDLLYANSYNKRIRVGFLWGNSYGYESAVDTLSSIPGSFLLMEFNAVLSNPAIKDYTCYYGA